MLTYARALSEPRCSGGAGSLMRLSLGFTCKAAMCVYTHMWLYTHVSIHTCGCTHMWLYTQGAGGGWGRGSRHLSPKVLPACRHACACVRVCLSCALRCKCVCVPVCACVRVHAGCPRASPRPHLTVQTYSSQRTSQHSSQRGVGTQSVMS